MRLTHFSYAEPNWSLTSLLPLQEVNLLVGKNAVGKSKVIESINRTANYILQSTDISENETFSYFLIFEDENEIIKYWFDYVQGKVHEEYLEVGKGRVLLRRNEESTLLHDESINPPANKLTLHVRRDTKQYPYIEKIMLWAEHVHGQRFNEIDFDSDNETISYMSVRHRDNLYTMVKALPETSVNKVIEQARKLGYLLESIDTIELGEFKKVLFKEEGVKSRLLAFYLSKGMCRTIHLLIYMEYLSLQTKPSLLLIDDLSEGLDYDRSTQLGKLLFSFCLEHNIQLIVTSNDTFLMDVVDLRYWNILQRTGSQVTSINVQNNPELFADFKFTGLSNFDFYSSDYIARHTQQGEDK